MSGFYVPTMGLESWRARLAEPNRHWRDGHSAKYLAKSWEHASGFPQSVEDVFSSSDLPTFDQLTFLCGFPEHEVPLPPRERRPSQNDIFVLAKNVHDELISMTVEGKVSECFGEPIGEWLGVNPSQGKRERLQYLKQCLELDNPNLDKIRYQLLHRTASAIIESIRFGARIAVMIVHSFSCDREGFEDYCAFLSLWGESGRINGINHVTRKEPPDLYLAWISEFN